MIFSQDKKGNSALIQEQTGGCLPHSYGLILGSQELGTMILVGPFQSQILHDSVMPEADWAVREAQLEAALALELGKKILLEGKS